MLPQPALDRHLDELGSSSLSSNGLRPSSFAPEKLHAQLVDTQQSEPFQILTPLLRRRGGWFANHALQQRPAGQRQGSTDLFAPVAAERAFPAAIAQLGL